MNLILVSEGTNDVFTSRRSGEFQQLLNAY
jgi:hypothetical protein